MTLPPAREEWGAGNPDDETGRGHKRLLNVEIEREILEIMQAAYH
jgi:hypothetical protein